jgi:hypothetical protein
MHNDKPETIRQAKRWDVWCDEYADTGFCPVCSAQAAWGHQLGFTQVRAVCSVCTGMTPPYASAKQWVNGDAQELRSDDRCRCGSRISGRARWGDDWGGGCDRAEARVTALMDRLKPVGT